MTLIDLIRFFSIKNSLNILSLILTSPFFIKNSAFFLEQIQESTLRLRNFVEQASKATLSGDIFDDAATGQGLLNFFFRALNSGAIDPEDVEKAGVTVDEIKAGSFRRIVEARR